VVELNRLYIDGSLRVKGTYSTFLEAKEQYLHAQEKHQEALENLVHTEIEWLRRGPKARATKAKARIDKAHKLMGELAELNSRSDSRPAQIDFTASNRKTKKLLELQNISYAMDGHTLFSNLDFTLTSGTRIGLVGPNGSGKTTLLRLLKGEVGPSAGKIQRADGLRIVHFDQRRQLDFDMTLRRALAPDSDAVIYQGRVIHVASWAAKFLFDAEDLNQKVGKLSGGERARVLIAQLMLQEADILLLDEPTNDLDIPTLEILEQSLLEYNGTLVLVTHDRYMLDRVATVIVGLDGKGAAGTFADYSQWEEWQRSRLTLEASQLTDVLARDAAKRPAEHRQLSPKKKLSYQESREFAGIEQMLAAAERELQAKIALLTDPTVSSDGPRLLEASREIDVAHKNVQKLYARWAELEEKNS
jgi:ATP-binding cassette subfamily F protein uup